MNCSESPTIRMRILLTKIWVWVKEKNQKEEEDDTEDRKKINKLLYVF
jgi:hypothetical protein